MPRLSASLGALLGLAGLCAGALGGMWFARSASPDVVLAHGFGRALSGESLSWSTPAPNIWLSSLDGTSPTAAKVLAVGDTITIEGKQGRPETIEITSLEYIGGDRFGLPALRIQLVTGLPVGESGHAAAPVRFLFAVEQAEPTAVRRPSDRVL